MSDSTSCREAELRLVSDDPADVAWARRHAAECAECSGRLAAFADLERAVGDWRAASPEPSADLAARIRVLAEAPSAAPPARRSSVVAFPGRVRPSAPRRAALVLAAAAGLLLSAGLLLRSEIFWSRPAPASALLVERALHEAEIAEAAHARAIAQLEEAQKTRAR